MANLVADKSAGTVPDPQDGKGKNNWTDVQNLLGFLLAGFGAVLSFIGLRTTEVTTVLRNYPDQASLIALFLLLGVLSAVLIVATDTLKIRTASYLRTAGIILVLFGAGALVIFAIPAGESPQLPNLVIGIALMVTGIAVCVVDVKVGTSQAADVITTQFAELQLASPTSTEASLAGRHRNVHRLLDRTVVPFSVIFIEASVIFIAISAYGAMRLETNSQRSFDAQVVASVSRNASGAAVSVHVTASRIKNDQYVGISVSGLPRTISLLAACKKVGKTPKNSVTCPEDPCYWLRKIGDSCQVVMAATIPPNDSGNVDETLNAPLLVGQFQDLHFQAVICSNKERSCFPISDSGSKLDIFVPTSQTSGSG